MVRRRPVRPQKMPRSLSSHGPHGAVSDWQVAIIVDTSSSHIVLTTMISIRPRDSFSFVHKFSGVCIGRMTETTIVIHCVDDYDTCLSSCDSLECIYI